MKRKHTMFSPVFIVSVAGQAELHPTRDGDGLDCIETAIKRTSSSEVFHTVGGSYLQRTLNAPTIKRIQRPIHNYNVDLL